jgi:hypothetical protein
MVTSTESTELTPQERLAISRKAIVKHMNRHHHREIEDRIEGDIADSDEPVSAPHGTLSIVKNALRVWWHRNPASAAAELAHPLLSNYARAHPFKLLGISAAVGVGAMVIRPWRMVSVGALLVAAVKSSGVTSALVSMLSSLTQRSDKIKPPP